MRRLALILLAVAFAGCARDDGEADLPAACSDSGAVASALHAAPGAVRLDGRPISDCLPKDASVGDVQVAGAALLEAAQRLGRERDAVAVGYLLGALRRGAERSQGIHLELVRRVEQEVRPFRRSPGFERGLRAGRSSG